MARNPGIWGFASAVLLGIVGCKAAPIDTNAIIKLGKDNKTPEIKVDTPNTGLSHQELDEVLRSRLRLWHWHAPHLTHKNTVAFATKNDHPSGRPKPCGRLSDFDPTSLECVPEYICDDDRKDNCLRLCSSREETSTQCITERDWLRGRDDNPSVSGDGDMTLFNGLLCLSGESTGCRAVANAQFTPDKIPLITCDLPDKDQFIQRNMYAWGRSPRRADPCHALENEEVEGANSFSRDMFLGVLLYFYTMYTKRDEDPKGFTRAKFQARSYLTYLKRISHVPKDQSILYSECMKQVKGTPGESIAETICEFPERFYPYRLCEDATDTRCMLNSSLVNTTNLLFERMGLGRALKRDILDFLESDRKLNGLLMPSALTSAIDTTWMDLTIESTEIGYPLHLLAIDILLHGWLDPDFPADHFKKMVLIRSKAEGRKETNPFYQFMVFGPTVEVKANLLNLCPKTHDEIKTHKRNSWTWERDVKMRAWERSMLWDCIMMANMLLPD